MVLIDMLRRWLGQRGERDRHRAEVVGLALEAREAARQQIKRFDAIADAEQADRVLRRPR